MIRAVCLAAGLAAASTAAAQPPQASDPPVTLQQLEAMALANHPAVLQARLGTDAARARARQAGAWPNPTIGYIGEEISPGPTIRGGEHGAFFEQTIPLGAKLRLNRAVFEHSIAEEQSQAEAQQLAVLTSVRELYYVVLVGERRVAALERLSALAEEAVGISRQLFNVGGADRPDVLESEIQARRTQLDLDAARNGLHAARQQLSAAAGDPTVASRPLAGSIDEAVPELEREATLRALLDQSPVVHAARAASERARATVARARRETSPDLFVRGGVAYNRELLESGPGGGRQPVGWEGLAEVGVTVPLFNRNQGGIAAARADEGRADAERRRRELELQSQFAVVYSQYLTALRASEVYRDDMLPRAEEAHRLYLERYREMGATYPQVLAAQRTLFQTSAEYLDQLESAWRAVMRLRGLIPDAGLGAPMTGAGAEDVDSRGGRR
jgi:cobalt-zinc-cadmium efflux system outer membrane protein